MMKRLIALALVLTMAISMVPVTAGAENEGTAVSNDVTLEGTSSFGNLLTNTVNESQQEGSGEAYDARICDLVIEGATATVEYTTPVEANLVVAIYDQNSGKMLGSGTVAVSPEETIAEVAIEIPVMPYYFSAGAYLLDAATNDPVSEEFKTDRYTKVMQDILAATVEDFNPELVLNLDDDKDTNFAVFNENTLVAKEGEASNIVTGGDGTYTIKNADARFLAMQPGDTFTYTYTDGTVLIVNAASVRVSGDTVTVTENPDADLSMVFDFVKIQTSSSRENFSSDACTLAEGVTSGPAEGAIPPDEYSDSYEKDISHTFLFNAKPAGVNISGQVTVSVAINFEFFLDHSWKYFSLAVTAGSSGYVDVGAAYSGDLELGVLPIPLGTALVRVEIAFAYTVDVRAGIRYYFNNATLMTVLYDSTSGMLRTDSVNRDPEQKVALRGSVSGGLKLEIRLVGIHDKVVSVRLAGLIGFRNIAEVSIPISYPTGSSVVHACQMCLEGKTELFFRLTLELCLLDTDILKLTGAPVYKDFVLGETDQLYYSETFDEDGHGPCPHKAYRVTVCAKSQIGKPCFNASVTVSQNGAPVPQVYLLKDGKVTQGSIPNTDITGASVFYLPEGEYKVQVNTGSENIMKTFGVKKAPVNVDCVLQQSLPSGSLTLSEDYICYTQPWSQNHKTLKAFLGTEEVACQWTSSNETAISVDDNGMLMPHAAGDAYITASYNRDGISYTAQCFVTILDLEVVASGTCGDNLLWFLEQTDSICDLTIVGIGKMHDYDSSLGIDPPWKEYAAQIRNIDIKPGVTSVGNGAFNRLTNLALATFPETLKKIGSYAFANCTSLCGAVLPEGLETIGGHAFQKSQLATVQIPSTLTKIFADAFRDCNNLCDVHVSDMAKWCNIDFDNANSNPLCNGGTLYMNNEVVTNVHITEPVSAVSDYAFCNYKELTRIQFDSGVASIGKYAFQNCTGLTCVTLAAETTTIDPYAFVGCENLETVENLSGLETIGEYAFQNCAKLSAVQLPDTVQEIGYQSFSGTALTEVTIAGSAKIGLNAFEACPELRTVTIKSGVTEIPQQAFRGCGNLTTLTLPSTLTKIDAQAFMDCASLALVDIPGSVQTVGESAFSGCRSMESASIGNGVQSIGIGAFQNCASLKTLAIPESVTKIGSGAFKNCTALTGITLPSQLNQVLISTFSECESLTEITIPQGITQIGAFAFSGCKNLKTVAIPDSVTTIAITAFPNETVAVVKYGGTCERWDAVDGHNYLKDAVINCSDGTYQQNTVAAEGNPETVPEYAAEELTEPTEESTEVTTETLPDITEATEATEAVAETEENPDIQWYTAPAGAEMTVEPVLQKLSAFTGTESGKNGVRSVKFTGLEPGEEYVLIVSLIPGSLVPENLLYIDQDNANPDGTLSFTYIPRQDVSARVQLYGVPAGRTVTLDREYLTMEVGSADQKLTAAVTPEEWAGNLTWSAENPENTQVISVNEFGDVTPMAPGTAYAVATVTHGQYVFSARCRVDVTQKRANQEVTGVQLGTTSLTTELLRTDYAAFDVILLLAQNRNPEVTPDTIAPDGGMEDNGVAIESAAFADEKAAAVFDLAVKDDRTLLVVPKASAINNPKPVAGSYTSKVRVTVDGKAFITDTALKLTVKKSMPKLKVSALTFNPFYTGQSQAIQITGATVTDIESKALPEWLTLKNGVLTLTEKAPAKASGKVSVTVKTAEWGDNISTNLTIPVKTAYAAPKLKLSAPSATFAAGEAYEASQGVTLKLQCANKNDTLEGLNISHIQAPKGFEIQNFDRTDGSFILKPTEAVTAGTKEITVSFSDTGAKVTLKLKISTKTVSITAKPSTVTLNSVVGDSAAIPLTASPADYQIGGVNIRLAGSRGEAIAQDLLAYEYGNGFVIVRTVKGKTQPNTTYKLYVSTKDTAKETVLTVKTLADTEKMKPTVSAKVSGSIDLSFPESCAVVTPVFKNYASGAVKGVNWTVTESKGKTLVGDATAKFNFTPIPEKNQLQLSAKDGLVPGNTYLLSLTYTLADDSTCSCSAKITVKRTPVKLKLSKTSLSLNRKIGDTAVVDVTCLTRGYDFTNPVAALIPPNSKDGQSIDLSQPGTQEPLTVSWSDGKLTVTANSTAEAGKTCKIALRATENDPAVTLSVKILDTAVTASMKASGTIDVVRNSTAITVTPAYKNYMGLADISPELTVESGNGKTYKEVDAGLFSIVHNENGTFTITKVPGAEVDTALKYRAKLTFKGGANPTYVNLAVKSGTAKVAVSGTPVLYKADRFSRDTFRLITADKALNPIVKAEIKGAKYQGIFEVYSYGSGEFAIGFKGNKVPDGKLPTSVVLNVYVDGNPAKSVASVALKLQVR